VAAQIIHDDDIARRERWHEELLDIIKEGRAIDWLIKDARCVDPIAAQRGQERHCFPVTVGHFGMEAFAFGSPAAQRSHVGLRPGLVDEDQTPGINPALILLPLLAPSGDLEAELFGGQHAFF
jgi:hypothetical protein